MNHHGVYIFSYDENNQRIETELPRPPEEKAAMEWDVYKLISVEPELLSIVMAAATLYLGSPEHRRSMFTLCLKEADKLVGEDARDPRLRSQAAWDFFNDYLFALLHL